MLRGTPFHSRTSVLCQAQNWRRWAGYLVAGSYELNHEWEYHAIRSTAALIDVSPLFKYLIQGRDAERLLNRVVTRDVSQLSVRRVLYTPWCDGAGKVIDDGTITRLDDQRFRLTSAESSLRWLRGNAVGLDVSIVDETETTAALSVQGPASRIVLSEVCGADLSDIAFFGAASVRIGDIPVTVTRTGYTGDLGYEIWFAATHAGRAWDLLVSAGEPYGLRPAGMLAMDVARIEAGLLLIDVDYVPAPKALVEMQKSSPFELGLGWTVKLEKDYFVGRDALRREHQTDAQWRVRGLAVDWDSLERLYADVGLAPQLPTVAWRSSVPVYANGDQVGYATSGCWSPTLKQYIAIAHLQNPHDALDRELAMEVKVEHRPRRATARVVKHTFFNPPRKRER